MTDLDHVQQILDANRYMVLATVSADGAPGPRRSISPTTIPGLLVGLAGLPSRTEQRRHRYPLPD